MAYMSSTWVDAALGVTVTTCVTRLTSVAATDADIRYPRAQLFAMALNTAYALADRFRQTPSYRSANVDRLVSKQTSA
jgi:D-alanyl-D-alanine carboxypeptidase